MTLRRDAIVTRESGSSGRWSWVLAACTGFLCAAGMIAGQQMDVRWAIGLPLFFCAALVFLPLANKERISLFLFFFLLPIALNFYPLLLHLDRTGPVWGIPINAYDLPLAFLLAAWSLRVVRGTERVLFPRRFAWLFVAIFACTAFGLVRTSHDGAMQASILLAEIRSFVVFLFLNTYLSVPERRMHAVTAVLLALIPQLIAGFMQKASGMSIGLTILGEMEKTASVALGSGTASRIGGLIGSYNQFAVYLGMTLPLAIGLLFAPKPPLPKLPVLLPLLAAGALLDLFTFSRAGWISLLTGASVAVFLSIRRRIGHPLLSAAIVIGGLFLFCAASVVFIDAVRLRIAGDEGSSALSRSSLVDVCASMIRDNALLGVGYGNFLEVAHRYDQTGNAITYAFPYPVHNEYLLIAAELGIPALLLFIGMLVAVAMALYCATRNVRDETHAYLCCGLAGCFTAWAVHQSFEWSYIFTHPGFWAFLALCMSAATQERAQESGA